MNTRTRLVWASLLCVPFFSLQASATTIVVPDEFENIATAFAAASAGDTILLRPGNHVVLDEVEIPAADITIVAERPLESLVYWGFGLVDALRVDYPNCVLQDIHFIAVDFITDHLNVTGTGLMVDGCILEGGFIGIDNDSADLEMRDSAITSVWVGVRNTSDSAGTVINRCAISSSQIAVVTYGELLVTGSDISDNRAFGGSEGLDFVTGTAIAAYSANDPVRIVGTSFRNNTAFSSEYSGDEALGGALHFDRCGDVSVTDCLFEGNKASRGGAIYSLASTLGVTNCIFRDNGATIGTGQGGAIYAGLGNVDISGNTVDGGSALSGASGVQLAFEFGPNHRMERNIVSNGTGGDAAVDVSSIGTTIECNNVWANDGVRYSGVADPTGTNGNISVDPLFCTSLVEGISSDSPCARTATSCGQIGASPVLCGDVTETPIAETSQSASLQLRVHPNPVGNHLRFTLSLEQRSSVSLAIFDVEGRLLAKMAESVYPAGLVQLEMDTSDLVAGQFFLRARTQGGSAQTKFLVR